MNNQMFQQLFRYKAWANAELLSCMRQIAKPRDSVGKIAIRTLNHVYVVDRIFEANLQGKTHAYAATNTPETPTLEELSHAISALDAWFLDYVSKLTGEALNDVLTFTFTDGMPGTMSRQQMLHHILLHGSYHRGAVGRILSELGIEPPSDIFTRYLHH